MTVNRVGHELRILNHQIHRFLENKAHKKTVDNITGTNGWIIGFIAEQGSADVYQKDLEQEFNITRSTASRVVDLMVKKGLIEKQRVAHDARLKKLVLTAKALDVSTLMKEDKEKLEEILVSGFSPDEIETLLSYVERMKKNVS